jgi:predicted XRE-type DNA-binding protein
MSGKPKFPPTTKEQATIVTLAAEGLSQTKIASAIGRSRNMVKNTLAEPEIQRAVRNEKEELAANYRNKARDVLMSICDADIKKASLQQKAVSTGILLDKSLVLTGEATENLSIKVLFEVAQLIRESERQGQQAQQLPPIIDRPK